MSEQNNSGKSLRLSLNKKSSSTMTLHGAGGTKKTVQVEVRKRKVVIDPQEIEARRLREEEDKRRLEEEKRRLEEEKRAEEQRRAEAARRAEEERRAEAARQAEAE